MRINKRLVTLGLSLLGVAGIGVTSYLAIKCHDKVKDEPDKKKKLIGYAPAIASGVISGACIMGSQYISAKEIAALGAAGAYLVSNRDQIMAKIREKYGDEACAEIQKEIALEGPKAISPIEQSKFGGKTKFVDLFLGREFYSTIENVEKAEREINMRFHNGEAVSMSDFYQACGLLGFNAGYEFGWPIDEEDYFSPTGHYAAGDTPIIFTNIPVNDVDGSAMYLIDITTEPMYGFMEV